jgi:hypothetical protein
MRIHRNTWGVETTVAHSTDEGENTLTHTDTHTRKILNTHTHKGVCEWSLSLSDQRTTTDCRVPGSADGVASDSLKGKVGGVCVLRQLRRDFTKRLSWRNSAAPFLSLSLSPRHPHAHTYSTLDIQHSTLYSRSITDVPAKEPSISFLLPLGRGSTS